MLSQEQERDIQKLKHITDKKRQIQTMKEKFKADQKTLLRDINRYDTLKSIYQSAQYQQLLSSTKQQAQQYQKVKQQFIKNSRNLKITLERLKLDNSKLEDEMFNLEAQVDFQESKKINIENTLDEWQNKLQNQLLAKQKVEVEIKHLKDHINEQSAKLKGIIQNFGQLTTKLDEQDVRLLRQLRIEELQSKYSTALKKQNNIEFEILMQISDKYLRLQQLQNNSNIAQLVFNNYNFATNEQELIEEDNNLDQNIQILEKKIQKEKQTQNQILADCEEKVKSQAIIQARRWIIKKLENVQKKKNTIKALLQFIASQDENKQMIAIQEELLSLERQQAILRQKINNN